MQGVFLCQNHQTPAESAQMKIDKHMEYYEHMKFLFNPFPNKPLLFTCQQYKSFKNTVGKGETARNEQFLLSPQCFLHHWRTFRHFHQI